MDNEGWLLTKPQRDGHIKENNPINMGLGKLDSKPEIGNQMRGRSNISELSVYYPKKPLASHMKDQEGNLSKNVCVHHNQIPTTSGKGRISTHSLFANTTGTIKKPQRHSVHGPLEVEGPGPEPLQEGGLEGDPSRHSKGHIDATKSNKCIFTGTTGESEHFQDSPWVNARFKSYISNNDEPWWRHPRRESDCWAVDEPISYSVEELPYPFCQ